MNDRPQEWRRGSLAVTTDRARMNLDAALALLNTTRWAATMTREQFAMAVEESIVFAILDGAEVIGIARVVTDRSTYGYLTDVVIVERRRGAGLGRWLVECVLDHRDLQTLRRLTLLTAEAPWLYEKFGFAPLTGSSAYMEIKGHLVGRARAD